MKNLLILHGALGTKSQFHEIEQNLSKLCHVHVIDFFGHGESSSSQQAFSIESFAHQVKEILTSKKWAESLVFGYSMGGYVALKLEEENPGTFSKILTLGTKFDWNPDTAEKESRMLNPEKLEEKVPPFASHLKSLHSEANWKSVLHRTAAMMLEMGQKPPLTEKNLRKINTSVHCMLGEKDSMVSEIETKWAVENLQKATLEIIPEWLHPINRIPTDSLVEKIEAHLL